MRVAVVGVGGVGGYFGGKLAAAGNDVVFIARGKTLEALRAQGLRVDSIKGDFALERVQATDDPAGLDPVEAVLMCVKAWQIPAAAEAVRPIVGPDTVVVPMENGMEAPEQIAEILGRQHAAGGLCGIVSFAAAPGYIRHMGADPFVMFGELNNQRSERLQRLCDAFVAAGVSAEIPPDIHHSMWSKFLFIAPMSGMGAITRVPIGVWRAMPETRELVAAALAEIIAVAAARGASLSDDAWERTMERYDGLTPDATSSLQRDVIEGKPSELDAQLGAVVRMARDAGVDVPVCDFMYRCLLPQERRARSGLRSED